MTETITRRADRSLTTFTDRESMERSARWVMGLILALLLVGLVMVYSARGVKADRMAGFHARPLLLHAFKVALGLMGMLAMMRFDYRALCRHYAKIGLGIVFLLGAVLLIGAQINGSRRWFLFFGNMIQPSEFAKPALLIVVAALVVRAGGAIESFRRGFLPPFAVAGLVSLLILMEPDFGTAMITAFLAVLLLVIGGAKIRHFILLGLLAAPLVCVFAYNHFGHVEDRVDRFLRRPAGGQVDFSLMAFGSGGILGRGLGESRCKLDFIAECDSDFIFAIIGEELGLLGTTAVVLLFGLLLYHGLRILLGIHNRFGFCVAAGMLLLVTVQAVVNMAVVMGMAPTKGLPLPFVSSGGSSMVALCMAMGLFLNVARKPDLPSVPIQDLWHARMVSWFFRGFGFSSSPGR